MCDFSLEGLHFLLLLLKQFSWIKIDRGVFLIGRLKEIINFITILNEYLEYIVWMKEEKVLTGMDIVGLPIIGVFLLLLVGFIYTMISGVLRNKKEE